MPRSIVVGEQDFAMLRTEDCFYVDKTHFISEWWRSKNRVTLITRPRRPTTTKNNFFPILTFGKMRKPEK